MKKLFLLAVVAVLFSVVMISCQSRSGHKLEELKAAKEKAYQDSILAISTTPPAPPIDSFFIQEPAVGEVYLDRLMPLLDPEWVLVGIINKTNGENCLWVGSNSHGDMAGIIEIKFEKIPFDVVKNLSGIDDFSKFSDGSITIYIYGEPSEDPFNDHKRINKFVTEVASKMNGTMEILDYR